MNEQSVKAKLRFIVPIIVKSQVKESFLKEKFMNF